MNDYSILCPLCGEGQLVEQTHERHAEIDGHAYVVSGLLHSLCSHCGEYITTPEQSRHNKRTIIDSGMGSKAMDVTDAHPPSRSWISDFIARHKQPTYAESPVPAKTTAIPLDRAEANPNLLTQIADYLSLPDDWDGYGGKPANLATVMDTFDFLKRYPATFPAPKPMIGGSGVIGLYWESNGCYASIDFDGSGHYCYIADRPGDEWGEDRVPVADPLPQRLIEVIAEIANCFLE